MMNLLSIRNLRTYFYTEKGILKAVNGVSFDISEGDIFGIVGESGSGKTVTCLSIMRLLPKPSGKIIDGKIDFKSIDLLKINENKMKRIRGKEISMIFQEPMSSLNPVFSIGGQLSEVFRIHNKINKKEAKKRALEVLNLVGIPAARQRYNEYPHQLSGGMQQRVMIAMAVSTSPSLLIADEPTANLDVTIQAQILELIKSLQEKMKMAVIIITHNLGIISGTSNRVGVMYAGKIQEMAYTSNLFKNPLHPYTIGLINSIPRIDIQYSRLSAIRGTVPHLLYLPEGCKFHPRCNISDEKCRIEEPELEEKEKSHFVRCWKV